MKKILLALALSFGLMSALNAQDVDVLALVTKGKVTSDSAGVTKLSLDDKMQVKGGYLVQFGYTKNFSIAGLSVKELSAVIFPDPENEVFTRGLCYLGETSCYLDSINKRHYDLNKDRYKELSYVADPLKMEFLAFSLQRTFSFVNPYRPTVQYTTSASVIGISGNTIYKIRSADTSNSIVREVRGMYERRMKNMMGF